MDCIRKQKDGAEIAASRCTGRVRYDEPRILRCNYEREMTVTSGMEAVMRNALGINHRY